MSIIPPQQVTNNLLNLSFKSFFVEEKLPSQCAAYTEIDQKAFAAFFPAVRISTEVTESYEKLWTS